MSIFGFGKKKIVTVTRESAQVKALLFDTFGTTVDWLSGISAHGERIGMERGLHADWHGLAKEWRAHYKPAIKPVRERKRAWAGFDQLHREELDKIVKQYGAKALTDADRDRLTHGWHELRPWPDVVPALHRLKRHFIIAPLSNATLRQSVNLAKYGGLPWDVVFGADMFRTYKPDPKIYLGAAGYLALAPENILMVAAHNEDLQAAKKQGLQTCFVSRETEDRMSAGIYTHVVQDFEDLARTLGVV